MRYLVADKTLETLDAKVIINDDRVKYLENRTERQAVAEFFGDEPEKAGTNKLRGGRPRNPENEWVRTEVFENGRDRNDPTLFNEWFEMAKANGRQFDGDPKDSFRKIFRLKPEETEETE